MDAESRGALTTVGAILILGFRDITVEGLESCSGAVMGVNLGLTLTAVVFWSLDALAVFASDAGNLLTDGFTAATFFTASLE